MATTMTSEQLRLRIDASKYAEPGQVLSVRISGSAREALEFERVTLQLFLQESVPGRHGPRLEESARVEVTVLEQDVQLTKGQNVHYSVDLEIPPMTPPTTGSAQHSLTYELRAQAVSGFEQAVGSARRSVTVQCCRSRSGGIVPDSTEQQWLTRTYKSDLLFGLIPVGSQVSCDVEVDQPVYAHQSGFMLGDRFTGRLGVTSRKTYLEAHLWWGTVVRGGGKTEKTDLGGPVHVPLDENQRGSFSFNLPDRGPVTYMGVRVEYTWFLRVELTDPTGSNHKEEFAFVVLPRIQERAPLKPRESLTQPRSSLTTPQGLSSGSLQGLTLGSVGGLTTSNLGGLKLGSVGGLKMGQGPPQGLVSRSLERRAPPEGLHQSAGGAHLKLEGMHLDACDHTGLDVGGVQGVAPIGMGDAAAPMHMSMSGETEMQSHASLTGQRQAAAPPPALGPIALQPVAGAVQPLVTPPPAPKPMQKQGVKPPTAQPLVTPPPAQKQGVKPPTPQPPQTVQAAVAAQLTHEGGGVSPEVVQYLAKIVQSSPFFANLLPDDLVQALSSPDALKGHLTPELRQILQQKLQANPQVARVLPPHLAGGLTAAKTVDEAENLMGDALTGGLLEKIQEHPRLGVALKYIVSNFPAFKKRVPSAVLDALPEGPGKIDLGAVAMMLNDFPELRKHIPAGIQAMLGSRKK